MKFSRSLQHRQPWVWALVLAWLWLTGWGQWHRVLHPVTAVPALSAKADAQVHKAPQGGHDEGSSLCQLLDHLSLGSAPVSVLASEAFMPLPQGLAAWTPRWLHGLVLALFEARGPPHFA